MFGQRLSISDFRYPASILMGFKHKSALYLLLALSGLLLRGDTWGAAPTDVTDRKIAEYVKISEDLNASSITAKSFEWQVATPESQGMSSAKLDVLWKELTSRQTTGLLVIRNDRIIYEKYAEGWKASKKHYTASMAKALVGGVALAVVISDGRIALGEQVAKYIPQWRNDPAKSKITICHLGSHTSGLEDAETDELSHHELTGWKGDFWKRLPPSKDSFSLSRDAAPLLFEAGSQFQYSNSGIAMLGYAITAALQDAPEKDLRTLLRDRVMRPIGVPDDEWSIGYGQTINVDGLPLVAPWGGGDYSARASARVGRLMLRGGNWEGKQLISEEAVRQTTIDAGLPGVGAMGWRSNNEGKYANVPKDAFWGSGAGHQVLLVVKSLNLIVVRNGNTLDAETDDRDVLNRFLFEPLMDATKCPIPLDLPPTEFTR